MLAAEDPTGGTLQFVRDGGIIGILVVIVIGAIRGWWYTRGYVDELRRDRDEWKQIALSGTRIAERVAEGSGTVLEQALRRGRS